MPQATFVELPSESNCCGRLYPDFLSPSRFSLECGHDNSRGHSAHHLSGNAPVPRHVWAAFSQFRTIPASTGFRASTETFEKRSLKVQAQIGLPGRWTRGVRQACLVSTRKGYLYCHTRTYDMLAGRRGNQDAKLVPCVCETRDSTTSHTYR